MSFKDRLFVISQHLAPQHAISRLAGQLADARMPAFKNSFIRWFIRQYGVNMQEAARESVEMYESFNDFFTRELKPGIRNTTARSGELICPVDGTVSEAGAIEYGRLIQAKNQSYSLINLLGGDLENAQPFLGGEFNTIYLSPKDYHRIHMPITGELKSMVYVPGQLFSVNQVTAQNVSNLFARNERVVCFFDTAAGPLAMVLVGAMIVASVETTWAGLVAPQRSGVRKVTYEPGKVVIKAGEEMGRFHLGSTVIMVFAENRMSWAPRVKAGVPVQLGQIIGKYSR
jgi:phosphatidylserine decarboxylase